MAVRRTAAGWVFVLATMSVAPGCGDAVTSPSAQMDEALRLSVTSATLKPGESLRIEASAAGAVSWESSDPSVVAVSPGGVVAARKEGDAQVTARSNGRSARAKVKVTQTTSPAPPAEPAPPAPPAEPAPTPTQPVASTVLYGHDFNDGTIGAFGQWGGNIARPVSVIADPTGSGRGKVARVDYLYDPASGGSHDSNGGLYYRANPAGGHPGGVGFGERIYLAGDFYLPRYPYTSPAQAQYDQRKLVYLKFGDPNNRTGHVIVNLWGRADRSGMDLSLVSGRSEAGSLEHAYGVAPVAFDQWHRVEVEMVVNNRNAADGSIRVWLNGRLVKERTNIVLFGASPSPDQDFIYEYGIGNQEQWSATDVMKDYRIWDNIQFRTARP